MVTLLSIFSVIFVILNITSALPPDPSTSEICSSKQIRHNVKNLNELRGCRVIVGSLTITLIERYNESDYDGMEFPELTEVTDYVLLFRVFGLKSLGKLFPNLRIIRGNKLVADVALIIYEVPHLQEIGLKSLLKIDRGSVQIEHNPQLCFVDTIDWSRITSENHGNVFRNNKAANECPICPTARSVSSSVVCPEVVLDKGVCWNPSECQQICPPECGNLTCNAKGECCDESCIGCANYNTTECLSCRYMSIESGYTRQCVQKCPANTYAFENNRCVTEDECRRTKRIFYTFGARTPKRPYIPHEDGVCSYKCPNNYYPAGPNENRRCEKCGENDGNNDCKRSCPPIQIDNISTAQYVRGCAHITGDLIIRIRNYGGQNIMRELETSLGDIEVIDGKLSIIQSPSLVSLGFFKKLRIIKGKNRFGLKVLENPNLETLFTQRVTIEHGGLLFHFNPKLCMKTIEEFKQNVVNLRDIEKLPVYEVSPYSNGDKVTCDIETLTANVTKIGHNKAVLELKPLSIDDDDDGSELLGYMLYYKPTLLKNISVFEGHDVCVHDDNAWILNDIQDNDRHILTQLKPSTRYAYFVQTYTVDGVKRGGSSELQYFGTLPAPTGSSKNKILPSYSSSEETKSTREREETLESEDALHNNAYVRKIHKCPAGYIGSVSSAQRYRGCTYIKGSLVISIRNNGGQNIARELETLLGDIEVIEGNLSIIRSFPLISLGFFKNLRIIKGETGGTDRFGLKVLENLNLEVLFTQNVTIEHGRLLFYFNPKLCMKIIEEFKQNVVDLRNVDKLPFYEVTPNSNGNKVACDIQSLTVSITKINYNVAILELKPLYYDDERQLLGYTLHYMPAPFKNVSMFEGRDACGCDAWTLEDIEDNNRNSTIVTHILTQLKPYTQYAYFVRTRTVASEQRGGLSEIQYFRTLPWKPEPIQKLTAVTNGSSEFIIKWSPPLEAHGNLTKYIIKCEIVNESAQLLEQRNYCREPLEVVDEILPSIPSSEAKPTKEKEEDKETKDSSCSCAAKDGKSKFSETEAEQLFEFEDALHNTVYVMTDERSEMEGEDDRDDDENERKRRDLSSQLFPKTSTNFRMHRHHSLKKRSVNRSTQFQLTDVFPDNTEDPTMPKSTNEDTASRMDPTNKYFENIYKEVNASVFSYTLSKLKHYTYYSISVKACREDEGDSCSNDRIAYQRTGKIKENDDVSDVSVEKLSASNNNRTGVRLSWKPPGNPNGITVSYIIRYQRVDIEHASYADICIPHDLFRQNGNSHIITDLSVGNYSFTVVANSLAGLNTRWSSPVYFEVDKSSA